MRQPTIAECVEMDDIFNDIIPAENQLLVRNDGKFRSTLEVTLNHPQTAAFKRMNGEAQCLLYDMCLIKMIRPIKEYITDSTVRFEQYQSGMWHVHIQLQIATPFWHCQNGLVEDIVRGWLATLPNAHKKYREGNMHYGWHRYRCPSCVVQSYDITEFERAQTWRQYIDKNNLKV